MKRTLHRLVILSAPSVILRSLPVILRSPLVILSAAKDRPVLAGP